jgi:hypothetical protein
MILGDKPLLFKGVLSQYRILRMPRLVMLWTILIQNLQGILGVSVLVHRMVFNLTAPIVQRTLAGQFL